MAMPNKKGWLSILFILLCLAIPFGITYYASTDMFKNRFEQWRGKMPQAPENASLVQSRTINDQVVLVKGERIPVYNTSLVFKGTSDGQAQVDLYLEELDPDHPYVQSFPEDPEEAGLLRMGDVVYGVTSITPNTLVLKILQKTGTL